MVLQRCKNIIGDFPHLLIGLGATQAVQKFGQPWIMRGFSAATVYSGIHYQFHAGKHGWKVLFQERIGHNASINNLVQHCGSIKESVLLDPLPENLFQGIELRPSGGSGKRIVVGGTYAFAAAAVFGSGVRGTVERPGTLVHGG